MERQKGLATLIIVLLVTLAIGGYVIYQKQFKPIPVPRLVTKATPVPTAVPTPLATSSAETANWKTYSDEKYNFSFQYPSYFCQCGSFDAAQPLNRESRLALGHIKTQGDLPFNGIQIFVDANTQHESFEEYAVKESQRLLQKWKDGSGQGLIPVFNGYLEQTQITVSGMKGIKIKGFWKNRDIVYIPFPGNQRLLIVVKFEESQGSFDKAFDQILSTFSFAQ